MSSEPENERPVDQTKPFAIKVADRVHRLPPYLFARINGLLYQKRRSGIDVIDLGMGNPSDPPQELVIEKLAEAARDPDNHGYTHATGILNLRREIAAKYFKKYGARLDPETETLVSMGSKDAFSHLILALIGPGDTAIVPAPSYPAHVYAVVLAGGNVMPLEIADPKQYLANIADACEHMYPKPKVVVANFPHNPSAVTIEPDFWLELVKLSRRYGFMVISDSAYADLGFDGYVPPSFLAAPGAKDVGVELTTMSKGYNMAGWRVGFCCGNSEMIRALATTKAYYDYGMFKPIQIAAIMALRHTDAAVEAQAKIYQSRRDVLVQGLRRLGWDITEPRAGMFVWAKVPKVYLAKTDTMGFAMKLLEDANVAVSPGSGFGQAGEGFLRLAMVENENRLRQAVRQIGRCLGQVSDAEADNAMAAPSV